MTAIDPMTAYMASCACRRFVWGKWDCCLFASDVVHLLTGHDPATGLRGAYSTEEESLRVVAAHGGLRRMCIDRAHLSLVAPPYRSGDIGIARCPRGPHAQGYVVLWQGRFYACAPEVGLYPVHSKHVQEVYRCP